MASVDLRARSVIDSGKSQGRRRVRYRDVNGKTHDAYVLGAGTASGLKLKVPSLSAKGTASSIKDNVALATSRTQTNVYFASQITD